MFKLQELLQSGATVPAVKTEDIRQVLALHKEILESRGGDEEFSIGAPLLQKVCSPGADLEAVNFRASMLNAAIAEGELIQFLHDDTVDEAVINLFASFPFRATNIQPDGSFQLNGEEFEEELRKLAGPVS